MKRRKFIQDLGIGLTLASAVPSTVLATKPLAKKEDDIFEFLTPSAPPAVVNTNFISLLDWLKNNQWIAYLKNITGVEFDGSDTNLIDKLSQPLQPLNTLPGFEDFAGIRLIEPCRPSMSLLYHALASPRVRPILNGIPFSTTQYPSLQQIDLLEDYIYSLKTFKYPLNQLPKGYVLAMFAYEYRPAYKTPDPTYKTPDPADKVPLPYADLVFSRTGISRIGEYGKNYDAQKRCFINAPAVGIDQKAIAVTPSRFGLFIAKILPCKSVTLYSKEANDDRLFRQRSFLQPIRKIFNADLLINGGELVFYESHLNEKLRKLAVSKQVEMSASYRTDEAPFIRKSNSSSDGTLQPASNNHLVDVEKQGSSLLVSAFPAKLLSVAKQDGLIVGINVKPKQGKGLKSDRRYTSLKLLKNKNLDILDYILTEGIYPSLKATRLNAPRNVPMFLNIRNKVSADFSQYENMGAHTSNFEAEIENGCYKTALFEDNICEGSISCKIKGALAVNLDNKILPAYSLVAAPDFFPFADSYDLTKYDRTDTSFLEGGIENLSYCRLKPNPYIMDAVNQSRSAFRIPENINGHQLQNTMLAILSSAGKAINGNYSGKEEYKSPELRDYMSTSFLPDTAAFVFAPGWEASYSSPDHDKNDTFLATFGLGSPFPEDMKLCAAANGMWPVASPDAARTFQGSLTALPTPQKKGLHLTDKTVPPTAIPLLDEEIGIHKGHPGLFDPKTKLKESYGWDGEQGPFLDYIKEGFRINFTDIGRADYVENLLNPAVGFNMSLIRNIDCQELMARIECLRKCKTAVEGNTFRFSKLWLISAEKVTDWGAGALGIGIPENLVGQSKQWSILPKDGIKGSGYLYLFAKPKYDESEDPHTYNWVAPNSKRRRMDFDYLVICQVTQNRLAWCKLLAKDLGGQAELNWQYD
ncbi:hypothetical protein HDC90_002682 [Pedobacter sp. AK013]|uniref:hypothetical protein n=1 Tax=Pedobacter sp. AK013 TaxID=2723071 RepID=UPI00161E7B17|nr:hypothetical protein [Pedobacter sp. AK013]MBB6238054.1 hypothetical protein [Pedobacter sp. AK013]